MAEYISTFITGFENVVSRLVIHDLKGARILCCYSGLLHYEYYGNPSDISRLIFLNNTFFVISRFSGKNLTFRDMSLKVSKMRFRSINPTGSFRVRFSKESQFAKTSKDVIILAEKTILRNCGLKIDRLNPTTEFWFIIRREGIGFFGQLLKKRTMTEKNLHRGELRPELAYLMCCTCVISKSSVICDPFAGYGAIPLQIQKHFKFKKMYVNDANKKCVDYLHKTPLNNNGKIVITNYDASGMTFISDKSVDLIISDPPWGFYSRPDNLCGFYQSILRELKRILANDGTIALLSGAPAEIIEAAGRASLNVSSSFGILVNGKKADIIILNNRVINKTEG